MVHGLRTEHLVAAVLTAILALLTSGHALLFKRDPRSAAGWLGLIFFFPLFGPVLYWMFGVNRIQRSAQSLRREQGHPGLAASGRDSPAAPLPEEARHLARLARTVDRLVGWPLTAGNRVSPLADGDEAYPAMLRAIDAAAATISLSTYIFNNDRAGRRFADALSRAVRRGVEVRVLIDDIGSRYSVPPITHRLRTGGIRVKRFLPALAPWLLRYWNMRSHRKLLVVDGKKAFTGGMNIAQGNVLAERPRSAIQDLQFEVEGPVVAQIQEAFAEDWYFCAGEDLRGESWFPALAGTGTVRARGVPDGPDADYDKLQWTLLAAVQAARASVRILTPYFLPSRELVAALNLAAVSGVEVDILIPARGNLRLVQWACEASLWQVLKHGCRVWAQPPPFDHSKLMLVDGAWSFLGSANWDTRSLRLNFEFNLECYDGALCKRLGDVFEAKRARARRLTLEELDARSLPVRLRDGAARLLTPYI